MYNPTLPYGGLGYNFNASFTQPMVQSQPIPATPIESIKTVHGEEGAKAFPLGAKSSVILVDETDNVVWFKFTDDACYATLKGYRLLPLQDEASKESKQTRTAKSSTKYVTKKEFDELKTKIEKMEESLNDKSDSEHARTTKRIAKE